MRYSEFRVTESRIVEAEPKPQTVEQYIDVIQDNAEDAEPKVQSYVEKGLDKIASYIKQKIQQVTKKPADVPAQEALEDTIDAKANNIDFLMEKAKEVGVDLQNDPRLLSIVKQVAKPFMMVGAQTGHETLNATRARIKAMYAPLAEKIKTGAIGFSKVPKINGKTSEIQDPEWQAYIQEMQEKRSSLDQTGKAVANAIEVLANKAMTIATEQNDITEAEKQLNQIQAFLQRCVEDPFIDFANLIKMPYGTVEEEFKKGKDAAEFLEVYSQFKDILQDTISKAGAGAWGPGELGLLMLSNPVSKQGKGDITVGGGTEVEVKASKKASSGARLNVEQALKGNLVSSYEPLLKQAFGDSVVIDGKKEKVAHQTKRGQVNFTNKGFDILNSWVDATEDWNKKKAFEFMIEAINLPMKNYVGTKKIGDTAFNYDKEVRTRMAEAITSDGHFDFAGFQRAYTKLLFAVYKAEMLDCILVINPILGTFLIMNDPDKDVDRAVTQGLTISGGIDFKDKQSTKSPQIGVGALTV